MPTAVLVDIMRMSLTVALASILLTACGSEQAHPPVGSAYSRTTQAAQSVAGSGGESSDPADPAAAQAGGGEDEAQAGQAPASAPGDGSSAVCDKGNLHLLGSCVAYSDGPALDDGAHCIEHWDAKPNASTLDLQYGCECAKAIWSDQPCSKLVDSDYCAMEASVECTRSVVCYPKKNQ